MMSFRFHLLFRKVTIIGVGLIGGSLGKAIKKRKLAREVVGYSQKPATIDAAMKEQAIDQGFTDLKRAVQNADLIVIATPIGSIAEIMKAIVPLMPRNCIITDVGSTKQSILNAAQAHLQSPQL